MPTEAELLAIRLTRMKQLVDVLDTVRNRTDQQEQALLKLKAEINAACALLKTAPPVESSS